MKTRRRSQKKRKTRRQQQKQKGGAQIFGKLRGKTTAVNITPTTTFRSILKKLVAEDDILRTKDEFKNIDQASPPYKIYHGLTLLRGNNIWDKEDYFLNKKDTAFEFRPNISLTTRVQSEKKTRNSQTLEILKKVLEHYKDGAKVISHSSATTDNMEKNVSQQFKFYKAPFSPIILVDTAFFSTEQDNYEFYKYLQFQEFTVDGIGPPSIVRFYRKEAGKPLKINPNTVTKPLISNEEKEKYLEEVLNQGKDNLTAKEIEICCINHYSTREFEIEPLLYPNQKFYMWSD